MAHRLTGSILRDHLRSVSGAFARPFEPNFARARPPDHVAFRSVMVTIVLLNVERTCAMPE